MQNAERKLYKTEKLQKIEIQNENLQKLNAQSFHKFASCLWLVSYLQCP